MRTDYKTHAPSTGRQHPAIGSACAMDRYPSAPGRRSSHRASLWSVPGSGGMGRNRLPRWGRFYITVFVRQQAGDHLSNGFCAGCSDRWFTDVNARRHRTWKAGLRLQGCELTSRNVRFLGCPAALGLRNSPPAGAANIAAVASAKLASRNRSSVHVRRSDNQGPRAASLR